MQVLCFFNYVLSQAFWGETTLTTCYILNTFLIKEVVLLYINFWIRGNQTLIILDFGVISLL